MGIDPLPLSLSPLQSPAVPPIGQVGLESRRSGRPVDMIHRLRSALQDIEYGREGWRVGLEGQMENIHGQLMWAPHLTFRCPRENQIGVVQAQATVEGTSGREASSSPFSR